MRESERRRRLKRPASRVDRPARGFLPSPPANRQAGLPGRASCVRAALALRECAEVAPCAVAMKLRKAFLLLLLLALAQLLAPASVDGADEGERATAADRVGPQRPLRDEGCGGAQRDAPATPTARGLLRCDLWALWFFPESPWKRQRRSG